MLTIIFQYSSRNHNHSKAISNWEKKSAYLLREIVKFSTYITALEFAGTEKEKVDAERKEREKEKEEREAKKKARLEAEELEKSGGLGVEKLAIQA